jgi:SAM-dependent methyltransferase
MVTLSIDSAAPFSGFRNPLLNIAMISETDLVRQRERRSTTRTHDEVDIKLNLGCGSRVVSGWVHVDYAVGAKLAKLPLFRQVNRKLHLFSLEWDPRILIHDLRRPLPWPGDSVAVVYSSHTLEHLSRQDGLQLLKESARILRQGGIIRIVVPDLGHFIAEYQSGGFPADEFVERLGVLYSDERGRFGTFLASMVQFPHRCMYDAKTLVKALDGAGFEACVHEPFNSRIEEISEVEIASRTKHALIVEGQKR